MKKKDIVSIGNIRKCLSSSYGNYAIDIKVRKEHKRFYKNDRNKLTTDVYHRIATYTKYFFKKSVAINFRNNLIKGDCKLPLP